MKLNDLKNAYPAIPRECHEALIGTSANLSEKAARPRRVLTLVALLGLLPLLAGAALAAVTHLGILNFDRDPRYDSLPAEAQALVAADLAEKTLSGVKLRVKEAYYDGRVLQILFSAAPLKPPEGTGLSADANAAAAAQALLIRAGLDLQFYHGTINVNGQQVRLWGYDYRAGEAPGEYEYLVDSILEYGGERLDGAVLNTYKFLRPQGSLDISIDINDLTGNKLDAFSFTLPAPDERKWIRPLPPPYQVNGCTVTFTDLHFSPVNAFFGYTVLVPEDIAPEGPVDWSNDKFLDLDFRFCPMGLTNEAGEDLSRGESGGIRHFIRLDNGDLEIDYYIEYSANGKYADTIYLSVDGVLLPIPIK